MEVVSEDDFKFFLNVPTRWSDNDMFGHLNNVAYYRMFEAVIVEFLIGPMGMDLTSDDVQTFVAESGCKYLRPLSWPQQIRVGFRVLEIGRSSVRYQLGLFTTDSQAPAALGNWVHVFVARTDQKPTPIPERYRAVYENYR